MDYNIFYLFGAGASAQKWKEVDYSMSNVNFSLPLAHDFNKRIDVILNYNNAGRIIRSNASLVNSLSEFSAFISQFNTIDEAMRKLYLNNEIDLFNHYKQLISLVFYLYEYLENFRDSRYNQFLLTLIDKKFQLPPNVKILSWNYDNQFEYAAKEVNNQFEDSTLNSFNYYKINGSANEAKLSKEKRIIDSQGNIADVDVISSEIDDIMLNHTKLRFAWEEYVFNKDFLVQVDLEEFLSVETKSTQNNVFVVIGYSFPFVNHKYDLYTLKQLKPKKIYYQDKIDNTESLSERFGLEFIYINDCKRFYIPNEMYEGFDSKNGKYYLR